MAVKSSFPSREVLDALYKRFNHRSFIHPDPLEFIYHYENPADREVVGLIASSLAYGRVAQILKSTAIVLKILGQSPSAHLLSVSKGSLAKALADFRHRFTSGQEMSSFLTQIAEVLRSYGSLRGCFSSSMKKEDCTVIPALTRFVAELHRGASPPVPTLLPSPSAGSACKRLQLYLRWMIRRDEVDPGCWEGFSPERLIVPLDTHMFSLCSSLHATSHRSPTLMAALEITSCFRAISPQDPVKYDFALTRLGIRKGEDIGEFIGQCGGCSSIP
jgi:uncharacterized protein (TIGR02757 family)